MEGWDCFGPYNTEIMNLAAYSDSSEPIASASAMMLVALYKAHFGPANLTDYDDVKVKCQNKCSSYYAPGCWMQRVGLLLCNAGPPDASYGCAETMYQKTTKESYKLLKWTWLCGLCDPPMYYDNVTDYIF